MKQKALISGICAYTILLPYLCRLPRGVAWAVQYLPFGQFGNPVTELLFAVPDAALLAGFSVIAAAPMVLCVLYWKHLRVTFCFAFAVTSLLLIYGHHDYDVAADAQAAVGLAFIPLYTLGITAVICGITGTTEWLIRKRPSKTVHWTGTVGHKKATQE
jgi:hypothetical protein